ncbi:MULTISPECIES: DUF6233 domain-containing protein [Streptomyces]|uniref:DUF6233 domain-containing protein n=1 Tax=Streptomyces TaxID=1883 RepID=UPI001E61E9DF|nr:MULTISPECIES: DUF6233 domain-containing protein [Streptomyces]UFQ18252.1 DUF6233 domain-containing protein [Streptomyces huasconensis]WCL87866.1 DUF6233 domain-containing protein [Streptomyces sp. JCM 35825]
MNDRTPLTRLDLLRFLERDQLGDLERTRRWIADEERRQAEQAEGKHRPPPPDWLLEQGINGRTPVYVHVGDCWSAKKRSRPITQDEARRVLADGVVPCPQCRPDTALGMLE